MAIISYWMLRRLASRSLAVLARNANREPALAAYEGSLGVTGPAFIAAYDKVHSSRKGRRQVNRGRDSTLAILHRKMRGWGAMLVNDVPGYQMTDYGDNPTVPEDVVGDAERVLAVVEDALGNGTELHYEQALRDDLGAAIEAARGEALSAGARAAQLSDMVTEVRDLAAAFQSDLVAFRRTLRAHLGSSHADYQKLRSARASVADEEDDEVAAKLPEEVPSSGPESDPSMEVLEDEEEDLKEAG